ncbi:MAG: hypothetical protein V7L29_03005 [Nostoc sp.]|uniref:hypothetical protein n=1 Tax=Nostoc sp. TaxID=1180 RepID=UPI002FF9B5FB
MNSIALTTSFSLVRLTITGTKVLTEPVIATITLAILPIDNEVKIAAARMISVGLYPSRIQVDRFSTDIGEAGINYEVWVVQLELTGVVKAVFTAETSSKFFYTNGISARRRGDSLEMGRN